MKKLKLLFASLALLVGSGTAWAQTDVTSTYLTNAGFESGVTYDAEATGDHTTGSSGNSANITGWTTDQKGKNTGAASFAYGTKATLNTVTPPENSPYNDDVAALGFTVGWNGTCTYKSGNFTLPAGAYKVICHAYNANTGAQYFKSLFGFKSTSGSTTYLSTKSNFASKCWNSDVVYFTIESNTEGYIQIGGTAKDGTGSGGSAKLFIDGVQIIKLDQTIATPSSQTDMTYLIKEYDCMSQSYWTGSGRSTANGQHWNGFGSSSYFTQNHEDGPARSQSITLPKAGVYTLKTAVRSLATGSYAEISFGDEKTKTSGNKGNTGGTVGSDGSEWDNVDTGKAANMTFANNNSGTGWIYNTVTLITDDDNQSKTISINLSNVNNSREADCGGMQLYYTRLYLAVGATQLSDIGTNNSLTADKWYYFDIETAASYSFVASNDITKIVYTTDGNIVVEDDAGVTDALSASKDLTVGRYYIKSSEAQTLKIQSLTVAKAAWEEAKNAAEAARDNALYTNVTGSEKTVLLAEIAKAEPSTAEGYDDAATALNSATSAFTAAKGVYDAYAEIHGVAVTLGVTPGDAPANAAAAPAATHALNVAVYNATTAANIFDVTATYNPSWSSMGTSSGQHWSGDGSISYADEWRGDTNPTTRNTTVTLPSGSYILMSAGRGSDNTVATMTANGTTVTFASNGDMGIGINKLGAASFDSEDAAGFSNKEGQAENSGTGWEWRYIPVTLATETAVTVTQTLTRLSGSAWGSFSDFKILKIGVVASSEDYTALNNAISAAEAMTLGFEDGEYAPYNNVAALAALAQAKAVDQDATNDQDVVQAITTALTGATWAANDGDVEAVFNGNFSSDVEGDWGLTGWTRTNGWGQQQTGVSGDFTTAYYNQPGSLKYGDTGYYTMPLKANTVYTLTMSFRSHEENSNNAMNVSVLNESNEGLARVNLGYNKSKTNWKTVSKVFNTGAAGNYVLTLENDGNTWVTNVSIVKGSTVTEPVEVTAAGYKTYCSKNDLDFTGMEVKAYKATATDKKVTFTPVTTVPAGEGVLLKGEGTFNVPVTAGVTAWAAEANAFIGVTSETTITEETEGDGVGIFVLMNGTSGVGFYKATAAKFTVGANTAYLPGSVAASRMFIGFDDEEEEVTGIRELNSSANKGAIYNMNGVRVEKAKKGLYIQNGKKFVVK